MKRLLVSLAAAALITGTSAPVVAAQDAPQVLNMQNADIRAFIQDIGRVTGVTYILDPRVQGQVTVTIDRPLSRAQLQEVLFSTLRANGLVAIPAGSNTYRVTPDDAAASQPSSAGGSRAGFTTQVFYLNTLEATDAAETLRPLVGRTGSVTAAPGNILIIADYADNLARIRSIIDDVDQDRTSMQTITLQNSSASELIEVMGGLMGETARVTMAPVQSSNSIVMRGDAVMVQQAMALIQDLDARAASNDDIRVVRLQQASAEELLPVLQALVGQTPTSQTGGGDVQPATNIPEPRRQASIAQFAGANALIISADPETQRVLAGVIRELDVRREQVLVEAIVVEVSDGFVEQLGVQLGVGGEAGAFVTNFPSNSPSLLGIAAAFAGGSVIDPDSTTFANAQAGAISSLVQTQGGVGAGGVQAGDVALGVIINAVKSDNASNLLSTPSIMTLDNQPAHLLVGQEVPISTGEVLGDNNANPFRTIERRDVGVILDVTPQINAGGSITLKIDQEVSSVAGPAVTGYSELAFNKRQLNTTVLVDNGDIVVLGGLLDQSDTSNVSGVPGLSRMPGIGGLFRSNNQNTARRNLMIFIRPRIVGDRATAQAVTAQSYEIMRQAEVTTREDARSALEDAVRYYLRANPPQAPAQ